VLEERREQLQLFFEELLVLVERIAEERIRLRERATTEDDLGSTA